MNKILKSTIFAGILLSVILTACSFPTVSDTQNGAVTPGPAASPTGTAMPAPMPTAPASATPELAPFCEAGAVIVSPPAQCQLPIAEESSIFCVKKKPYNLIFINKGATYEALTAGFWCTDAGMKDGRQMVTCTGQMATDFEVSVCDPACAIPTAQATITQCPQGYNYNNLLGCCTQEFQQIYQNCVTLKLTTKSCLVDCSVFRKKSICNKNYIACEWNDATRKCEMRK
jgi:hypothetical protein